MSAHNFHAESTGSEYPPDWEGGKNVAGYGKLEGLGTTVPTDGVEGWATGAIFQKINGTSPNVIYVNIGNKTSANFDSLGDILLGTVSNQIIGCEVYASTTQTIADESAAAITFDTEVRDVGGCHSTSSNTSRFTAPVAGVYMLTASTAFEIDDSMSIAMYIVKNGGDTTADARYGYVSSDFMAVANQLTAVGLVYLDEGDYLEAKVSVASAGEDIDIGAASGTDRRVVSSANFYRVGA